MVTMSPDEAATLQKLLDQGIVTEATKDGAVKFTLTVSISSDVPEDDQDPAAAIEEWIPDIPDTVYLDDQLYSLDIQGWQEVPE